MTTQETNFDLPPELKDFSMQARRLGRFGFYFSPKGTLRNNNGIISFTDKNGTAFQVAASSIQQIRLDWKLTMQITIGNDTYPIALNPKDIGITDVVIQLLASNPAALPIRNPKAMNKILSPFFRAWLIIFSYYKVPLDISALEKIVT